MSRPRNTALQANGEVLLRGRLPATDRQPHLRIKRFFGTSENTVKSQLWVAVLVYVLVATIRKQLEIQTPLYPSQVPHNPMLFYKNQQIL